MTKVRTLQLREIWRSTDPSGKTRRFGRWHQPSGWLDIVTLLESKNLRDARVGDVYTLQFDTHPPQDGTRGWPYGFRVRVIDDDD